MENDVAFFLFVSSLQIYFVLIEVFMDCYQHCVERYGISLSDKMVNQQKAIILKKNMFYFLCLEWNIKNSKSMNKDSN